MPLITKVLEGQKYRDARDPSNESTLSKPVMKWTTLSVATQA